MLTLDPNESSLLAQRIGQFGIMLNTVSQNFGEARIKSS